MSLAFTFSSEPEYDLYRNVYEAIWNEYGIRIVDGFSNVSHLNFTEQTIRAVVGTGDKTGSNYAGATTSDPMLFRYSVRDKLGTMFHELGHRLIMEHNYFEKSKISLGISNDHQLLDLFLYDTIDFVFGSSAAEGRAQYEMSFPEKEYRESWEWAFALGKSQRQNLLRNIVKQAE